MTNWLLVFVLVAIGLKHLAPKLYLLIFAAAGLAILLLAAWMGRATKHLAEPMGERDRRLAQPTFGNAALADRLRAALAVYRSRRVSLLSKMQDHILSMLFPPP